MLWSFSLYLLWYSLSFWPISVQANSALTALTHGLYVQNLYKRIRTEEKPIADPANSDNQIFQRICEDIIGDNEFLKSIGIVSVKAIDVLRKRDQEEYSNFFPKIYTPNLTSYSPDDYIYTNPYRLQEYEYVFNEGLDFRVIGLYQFKDYVFLCPVEDTSFKKILTYYVSKEYNVSSAANKYKRGRFVFGQIIAHPTAYFHAMLAEEPANAYTDGDFDVEAQFLRIRTHVKYAEGNDIDPLCQLVWGHRFHPQNQHHRLCVAVAKSMYFQTKSLGYPEKEPEFCHLNEVSLKRMRGAREDGEGATRPFYERMVPCRFPRAWPRYEDTVLYISRAYRSNQIFVYKQDQKDGKIYLENISTNVDVVDELNTFDFVED